MTKSSFCTAAFNAYYGQPEKYRQTETPPQITAKATSGASPYVQVLFPDKHLKYEFGDALHLQSALRHSRNMGRFAKVLADMHDNGLVSKVTDIDTKQPILSNRQKAEWSREAAKPEPPAPDREIDPMQETVATEQAGESQYAAGAQPMDKYAVKKPRSIFDSLPDLSDPGREQYASVAKKTDKEGRGSKPQFGQTLMFDKPFGSGAEVPKVASEQTGGQKMLTHAGTDIPAMGRHEDVHDIRHSKGEHGLSSFPSPSGIVFNINNPEPLLPRYSTPHRVQHIEHNGILYRLTHAVHPSGEYVHFERGVPQESKEGSANLQMEPLSTEAHAALQYADPRHPLVSAARRLLAGEQIAAKHKAADKKPVTSSEAEEGTLGLPPSHKLLTGREARASAKEQLRLERKPLIKAYKRAAFDFENARKALIAPLHVQGKSVDEIEEALAGLHASPVGQRFAQARKKLGAITPHKPPMAPPQATPPAEGRMPRIGGQSAEAIHPQLPVGTGPMAQQPSISSRASERATVPPRFVRFSLSSSAQKFADAVVEKYTQACQANDLLQRFAAAYYGEVERYGGQQAGHHIDFKGFNNGIPAATMTQPMKLQSAVGSGPPRHGRGSGAKAGTFAPNPLSGANKYASVRTLPKPKIHKPMEGQTSFLDTSESAPPEPLKPTHKIPIGPPSETSKIKFMDSGQHAKILDELGLGSAQPEALSAPSPLETMFKPPRNLKKMSDAELVDLHHQRDEAATNQLFKGIRGGVEYMMRKFPKYRDEIQSMIGSIDDAQGNPGKGTFQIALETYDPNRLGQDGKPASFATHHRNVLYNYVRNRPKRQQAKESMIVGGKGRGEYAGDEETSLREEPRSREASPAEVLLAQGEPSGRQQKQEALDRESFLVDDEISKMPPADQWLIEAHRGGLSPQGIASILQAAPGSEQLGFMSNHENKRLRSIGDDAFRSKVSGTVGKPSPENVQMQIDRIVGTLHADPTFAKIRQRREDPRDAAEKFADDVMRALRSPPLPKTTKTLVPKGKKAVRSSQGQKSLFAPAAPYALTIPERQLDAPPQQPPREGNERWALHTGQASDINQLKKLHAVATKRGLIFRVKMPPSPIDRQPMGAVRWFTFTPAKWKERFTQMGRPEKYGLFSFGGASGQNAPSAGSGTLGAFVAGLVGNRRGGAGLTGGRRGGAALARAFAQPAQAKPPATPKTPPPPKALTAAQADQLGSEMSRQNVAAASRKPLRDTAALPKDFLPSDYRTDRSTEAFEALREPAKPAAAKTRKTASSMTPEQEEHKRLKTENDIEHQKQRKQKLADAASGKVSQGRGRRGKGGAEAEGPPESFMKLNPIPPNQDILPHIKRGGDTFILDAQTRQRIPAYYAFVELDKIIGSHIRTADGRFVPNPHRTDKSEQPRDYGKGSENEQKVQNAANDKIGDFFTSTVPVPSDGPMTVDDQRLEVSNGSGRHQALLEAAARGEYQWVKDAMVEAARNPRIAGKQTPEEVAQMKHPALVRVVPGIPAGTDEFKRFASLGNVSTTHEEAPIRDAAQMGNVILDDNTMKWIGDQLSSEKSDMSVNSLLKNSRSPLRQAVIQRVPRSQKNKWIDPKTGQFTEYGVNQVEDAVLSRFIPVDTLERGGTSGMRSLKNAISATVPQLLQIGAPIRRPLEKAFEYIVSNPEIMSPAHYEDALKTKGLPGMEDATEVDEMARGLIGMLYKAKSTETNVFKPKDVRKLFSTIAGAAKERQRDDPLWVPTEEVKDMLSRHKRGEKFTTKERQKFADTLKAMGVPDAKGFVAMLPDQQQSILEDKRKRAARSSSFIEAHEGSWLDQVLERISSDEQKAQQQRDLAETVTRGRVIGAPSPKKQASLIPEQQIQAEGQAAKQNTLSPSSSIAEIGHAGGAIVDNFYDSILQSLQQKGDVPSAERNSSVGRAWIRAKSKNVNPEDFVRQLRESQDPNSLYPAQAKLFTQRRHHDATHELYTAVRAAYYRKTTFPPQRVARQNRVSKQSKVH